VDPQNAFEDQSFLLAGDQKLDSDQRKFTKKEGGRN
jgi:hypothetical protein